MAPPAPQKTTVLSKFRSLDLEARLRNYRYPSASEQTEFSELIAAAGQEMDRLETEVLRLQQSILALRNEKRELEQHVSHCKSLFAPIRKLPPEILSQIFLHRGTSSFLASSVTNSAMELATVCSHWNSVLRQPMFWSRIILPFDEFVGGSVQTSRVKTILSRSGDRPLSIWLLGFTEDRTPATKTDETVDTLIGQSHRWNTLQLKVSIHTINRVLQNLGGIPSLQSLEIIFRGEPDTSVPIAPIFVHAPQLRNVKLDQLSPDDISLPWNQLTHLEYTIVDIAVLMQTLGVCTNIQSVSVDALSNDDALDLPHQYHPVASPMKSLMFSFHGSYWVQGLCDRLVTSNLQSLHLSSSPHQSRWSDEDAISIEKLVTRSSCNITSLSLRKITLEATELIELCQWIPTITSLTIHEPGIGECEERTPICAEFVGLMDPYAVAVGHSILLPRLTNLDISVEKEEHIEPSYKIPQVSLMDIIQARWQPGRPEGRVACIQVVQLVLPSCPEHVMEAAKCLKHAGLAISLASVSSGTRTYI